MKTLPYSHLSNQFLKIYLLFIYEYMYVWPEEGTRLPGAGIIGGFKSPDVGAGNWTGPPMEQQTPLTTRPSLQLLPLPFRNIYLLSYVCVSICTRVCKCAYPCAGVQARRVCKCFVSVPLFLWDRAPISIWSWAGSQQAPEILVSPPWGLGYSCASGTWLITEMVRPNLRFSQLCI